jgi:FtsH-binding integral membrane protein
MAQRLAKIILWLTWLYPFLRGFLTGILIGIANHAPASWVVPLQAAGNAVHGDKVTSFFIMIWYPVYFVVTFIAYLVWHFLRRQKIGWKQGIVLVLVFVFNIGNTLFLTSAFIAKDPQEKHAQ